MSARRKRRFTGQQRRQQIVRVAERLFSRRGFRGTTTREIAKKAGISEATIFKHFSGKEDLYRAIINRCCDDAGGGIAFIKRIEDKHGVELFREVARFFMEKYREDPDFARLLMFSALEERNFSDIFIKSKGMDSLNYLSKRIEELMKKGVFRRANPTLCARAFLGMVMHYCMLQEIYGFKRFMDFPQEEVIDTFVDVFMKGMLKQGGR